jgi:hypothetical protein
LPLALGTGKDAKSESGKRTATASNTDSKALKSALAKRLILTVGLCIVALCLFIGVNVGFQLPGDSIGFFCAAAAVAVGLVLYLRYAAKPAPQPVKPSPRPAEGRAAVTAQPAAGSPPEPPEKSGRHA